MTILKTSAQAVSRVLRRKGYNPTSTEGGTRWPGLLCAKSGGEVRVRVWQNVSDEEPTTDDRDAAAEIAELLTGLGYKIRYETGGYSLYVVGKEV